MEYAICIVAAAPVRKEPSHKSEMTNQLLFGETVQVLERKDEWFKIISLYDDYEGWLTFHLINEVEETVARSDINFIANGLVNTVIKGDQLINVSVGASLTGFDEKQKTLWDKQYLYHGIYRNSKKAFSDDVVIQTAQAWLNAPYLWGGKTFLGVDCSGFVQTVFKMLGIKLRRDAYQQAMQGTLVENLSDCKIGDLSFFHNDQGRVTHVGIILNGEQIIHASGKVRIDALDEKGIINNENRKRTHQLHSMRRYF